jgi:hypothetical protein
VDNPDGVLKWLQLSSNGSVFDHLDEEGSAKGGGAIKVTPL